MSRLSDSYQIFKNSLGVIRRNLKLCWFILIVGILQVALLGIWVAITGLPMAGSGAAVHDWRGWLGVFGWLACTGFAGIFCNVAMYSEIFNALNGRGVSVRRGFSLALSRLPQIVAWSVFAATVGTIMRMFEERLGVLGRFILRGIGIVWAVATLFVVPVIAREKNGINPLNYLRRSAAVLSAKWGESIVGFVGITILSGIVIFMVVALALACIAVMVWGTISGSPETDWMACWLPVVMAVLFVVIGVVITQLPMMVYIGSLYIYATEGVIPEGFSQRDMDSAWKIKVSK
ncbi:MAG: DUF6159 family protein [Victivallaceae bacterium]|nr:DUF6159 family protein [Victivallaceae bacterium]